MTPGEFALWAARQPLQYELVDEHPVRLPEEQQAPFRLQVVKALAEAIFDQPDHVTAWMANASAEFGGLSPADIAAESEEGSQMVLRSLVRWHRGMIDKPGG